MIFLASHLSLLGPHLLLSASTMYKSSTRGLQSYNKYLYKNVEHVLQIYCIMQLWHFFYKCNTRKPHMMPLVDAAMAQVVQWVSCNAVHQIWNNLLAGIICENCEKPLCSRVHWECAVELSRCAPGQDVCQMDASRAPQTKQSKRDLVI